MLSGCTMTPTQQDAWMGTSLFLYHFGAAITPPPDAARVPSWSCITNGFGTHTICTPF